VPLDKKLIARRRPMGGLWCKYTSGWHTYRREEDAKRMLGGSPHWYLCRVWVKGAVTVGKESISTVDVAEQMKIKNEDWKKARCRNGLVQDSGGSQLSAG